MTYEAVMQNWKCICELVEATEIDAYDVLSRVYDDNSDEACDLRAVWDLCGRMSDIIAEEE